MFRAKFPYLIAQLFIFVAFLVLACHSVSAQELTGSQIMDEVSLRHDRPFEFEIQNMTLVDKGGEEEIREIRRYMRQDDDGTRRYLVVFHSPAGIKGVALLTWQNKDKDDDQFMYLPAQGNKMKRIAKGGQKNYFMGTDYAFEDLVSESREKFSYERLPDEIIDSVDSYLVRATPSDDKIKESSGYKFRDIWVAKDTFFITSINFYDRRGKLLKSQTNESIVNIEGDSWRANKITMDNLKNKHKTIIEISDRSFAESDVPEKNFRKKFVTSGQHIR